MVARLYSEVWLQALGAEGEEGCGGIKAAEIKVGSRHIRRWNYDILSMGSEVQSTKQ